ncbi:hypothetical protein DDI_2463 [Dickeya dianthicola RNS04.9]|nr:hypothetical protein DDI_2463 [Dickeya dianthicola RNS04.9]
MTLLLSHRIFATGLFLLANYFSQPIYPLQQTAVARRNSSPRRTNPRHE